MATAGDESNKQAIAVQQKFEFYVLGLTFTLLGLSVQTASFGRNLFPDGLELLAWTSLTISGLVGLSRLEGVPRIYELHGHQSDFETRAREMRTALQQGVAFRSLTDGSALSADRVLEDMDAAIAKIKEAVEPKVDAAVRKYRAQKRFFVAGIILLACARAFFPFVRIVLEISRSVR